jgi:hypothetical protein
MSRIVAALLSLAKNAVPAFGVLVRDWAPPGALLLYLGENIVLVLLGALTVLLVAPKEEVIEGKLKTRRESLSTFFLIAAPFTFGAAVFTLFVFYIRDEYTIRPAELTAAFGTMLALQLLGFATSLVRLRGITLAECEHLLVNVLGRVFLLAFAVWAGLLLAFFVSSAFVIPFMILKTIVDLGSLRPETLKRRVMQGV